MSERRVSHISERRMSRVELAEASDTAVLASLGYKQELRRSYSTFEVFGLAFSIMGPVPAIAATLAYSLPAGPVGMVWGWFLASGMVFIVGLAMADMGSAMPTSGGLYYWTHYFASPKLRNPLSFVVGYSNAIGLIGALCSIDYGFALMLLSIIVISRDGQWSPSNGIVYAVFAATIIVHASLASFWSRFMNKAQIVSITMNILAAIITIIALPVGRSKVASLNSGRFIFAQVDNNTSWPTGWTFMLAWLSPIWTIMAFDSCVHISEQSTNAPSAVPKGILSSIASCWFIGFATMIAIASSMNPDTESLLSTPFGQPMAQIYYDAVGKNGAIGLMAVLTAVQFLMGLSVIIATSCQAWAFSRDGAMPFSSILRKVSQPFNTQTPVPVHATMFCAFISLVLGLLCLIAPAAAQALFSLSIAGNNVAWGIAIFSRVMWGQTKFQPGVFYTGDGFSEALAWIAVIFLTFGTTLSMFPTQGPRPTADNMNYTVVVNCAVWGGALLYYALDARKWFRGPKNTLEDIAGLSTPISEEDIKATQADEKSDTTH